MSQEPSMVSQRFHCVSMLLMCIACSCVTVEPALVPNIVQRSEVDALEYLVVGLPYADYLEAPGRELRLRDDIEVWIGPLRATLVSADTEGLHVRLSSGLAVGRYDLKVIGAANHERLAALQVVERVVSSDGGRDASSSTDAGAVDAALDALEDVMADSGQPDVSGVLDSGLSACEEPDLIHCFLFEGTMVDGAGGRTLSGSVLYVAGIRGRAAQFDVGTDPVVLPGPTVSLPDSATVELWFRVVEVSGTRAGLFDQDNVLGVFAYPSATDGVFSLQATNGAGRVRFDEVTEDAWHHFVFVVTPASVTGYLDGAPQQLDATRTPPTTFGSLHIGSNSDDGADPFDGTIDHLRVWRRAMSAEEAVALYEGP